VIKRTEIKFVVFLCLLPIVLIVAAEAAGQAWMWFRHGVPGKTYGIYQGDPELGGILAPDTYNTAREFNNLAFQRAEETKIDRPAGQLRIVAYGGSTTFSYNVTMAQSWPALLENRLRDGGFKGAEVLNAGDVVWSLGHAIVRARREVERLKPDYVILYSGINEWSNHNRLKTLSGVDLAAELAAGRHGAIDNHLMKANVLFRSSLLYKFVHFRILVPLSKPDDGHVDIHSAPFDPAIQRNYDLVLGDFIRLIRKAGATPVFVVQAIGRDFGSTAAADAFRRNSAAMRVSLAGADVARAAGALVLDAQDAVRAAGAPAARLFGPGSEVHFSVEGSKTLADFMFEKGPWKK
jgi:hypothetical protein